MDTLIKEINNSKDLEAYLNTINLTNLHKLKLYLDDLYHNQGETKLNDEQYDLIKENIQKRDKNYIPPTGAKIRDGDNRVKLPYWLGSMDKFTPDNEIKLNKWISQNQTNEYIVEDKLDGVSCLIQITNGNIKLFTRGDGIIGADISYLSEYFKTIPKNLKNINSLFIRGELIMPLNIFNKNILRNLLIPEI